MASSIPTTTTSDLTVEPGDALRGTSGRLKDVWSRSGSTYRIRAIVLLAINVLLFAGVGSFAFWLRTGERFAPIHEGYWDELSQTFRSVGIMGQGGISLGSLLLEPINVQDVPMQIPILGLLMAALIAIPILVAILYRFWSSLPFIAVVGFLAVMPWLAITLLVSCVIASVRPFRARFRFMSAMLALVPAVVYLVLAWYGTTDVIAGRIDPVERIKFVAPWVLAIVAAAVAFAIVLAIARLVDYRPGAIAPLLALMFGLPVALFEFRVGRDELYYRLLERRAESRFADQSTSINLEEALMEAWLRQPLPRRSMEAIREVVETRWLFELGSDIGPHRSAITAHQAEVADHCDRFLKYFPSSRYAFNALYLKARALDMRVDPGEFRRTKWIRFYDDFPSAASLESWRLIAQNQSDSLLNAVARLRIAQLDARNGDVERAIDELKELLRLFGPLLTIDEQTPPGDGSLGGVLTRSSPESSLQFSAQHILIETHRLHDLLLANRDPIYGYDPISGERRRDGSLAFGLLDLDPRHGGYLTNLVELKKRYVNSQIEDNIDLEIAKATPSMPLKIDRLNKCVARFPQRDAVAEVLFRLGMAYKRNEQAEKGDETLARLIREHPNSIWATQAIRFVPGRTLTLQSSDGVRAVDPGEG